MYIFPDPPRVEKLSGNKRKPCIGICRVLSKSSSRIVDVGHDFFLGDLYRMSALCHWTEKGTERELT